MDEQTKRPARLAPEQKKRYHSPCLTEYGSLTELTTSGASGTTDYAGSRHTLFMESEETPFPNS